MQSTPHAVRAHTILLLGKWTHESGAKQAKDVLEQFREAIHIRPKSVPVCRSVHHVHCDACAAGTRPTTHSGAVLTRCTSSSQRSPRGAGSRARMTTSRC